MYEGSQSSDQYSFYKWRPYLDNDIISMMSKSKWRNMLSDGRWIAQNFSEVRGAVNQKAEYVSASGWKPQFVGSDTDWGKLAEQKVREANKICNVRGSNWSFAKSMEIGCTLWDIDGDFFILLTEGQGGFPKFQFLEAHKIGQRSQEEIVEGGPYDGALIRNGIIYNSVGRPMAYRVLGATEESDQDISADNMLHVANPSWFSEGRPFPTIAYSVLDWYDVKETREHEKTAQKANSAITILEETESGRGPINPTAGGSPQSFTGKKSPSQMFERGMIRYIKAGAGKLTSHSSNRPSNEWREFDHMVRAGAFYGMGWRIEMLDLSTLSGAGVRGFVDNINTTIRNRFKALAPFACKATLYQVAKLIKRGDIPQHEEWWKWTYHMPREYTVDEGRMRQTELKELESGVNSEPLILQRRGIDPDEFLESAAAYKEKKKKVAAAHGLTPEELGSPKGTSAIIEESANTEDE